MLTPTPKCSACFQTASKTARPEEEEKRSNAIGSGTQHALLNFAQSTIFARIVAAHV